MKHDLIEVLACPVCQRSPLEMEVFSHRDEEIIEADLTCSRCGRSYTVRDGIQVMLPDLNGQKSFPINNLKERKG